VRNILGNVGNISINEAYAVAANGVTAGCWLVKRNQAVEAVN